jgi:hypothetical protein
MLRPDDGGSKHLCNVGELIRDYTAQIPKDVHFHTPSREKLKFHLLFLLNQEA